MPKLGGVAEVIGVSRRPELLPEPVHAVYGDYTQLESLTEAASLKPDIVIFTPVPTSRDLKVISLVMPKRTKYLWRGRFSTCCACHFCVIDSGLCGEGRGLGHEDSPRRWRPLRHTLLDGETSFRRHAATTVLRPSGLYDIMLKPILEV